MASEYIWYTECNAVFGDYGLRATGGAEKEAKDALWKLYLETSPDWNGEHGLDRAPGFLTYQELDEYFGIHTRRWKVGKAYFGDEDESESYSGSATDYVPKLKWKEKTNES